MTNFSSYGIFKTDKCGWGLSKQIKSTVESPLHDINNSINIKNSLHAYSEGGDFLF